MIAGRYELVAPLGQGGTAAVYRVRDTVSGEELALKRLSAADEHRMHKLAPLFEQEFHTLAQLAHPRIVRVFDFASDDEGPLYTMELLDGGDLHGLAPAPWRRVCALLCDICSALALLHSRRLVHRDLSPRNVRCTRDGKAKLIDLGGLAAFGPCKQVVGTPPCIAPETINEQTADARTDLFALGATAYFALTHRYAYPARRIDMLRDVWRSPPRPPSAYASDVPPALDDLVMSLLQLQPIARPASAAEVMERLSAIADLEIDEDLRVKKAYLVTPTLVGRDDQVSQARKQLLRAKRGRGVVTVVRGAPGVGRSRFVDVCMLEAKLLGASTLRVDAADAAAGEWGGALALMRQLGDVAPEVTRRRVVAYAPVLTHLVPDLVQDWQAGGELGPRVEPAEFSSPQQRRGRIIRAMRDLVLDVAGQHHLMLAVDDVELLDAASAALVAALANEAGRHRLNITVTVGAAGGKKGAGAASWLSEAGSAMKLRPLDEAQTEALLLSMFGDVPNVRLLANRLFAVTRGVPAAIMQLAQHLLDQDIIRYDQGRWQLPDKLSDAQLPESLNAALDARVARLSHEALMLARALALCSLPAFDLDDCRGLLDQAPTGVVVKALDELVTAEIVVHEGQSYSLRHPSWKARLTRGLGVEAERALHRRIARLLSERPQERFRHVQHLFLAGDERQALDTLFTAGVVPEGSEDDPATHYDILQSLPEGWFETLQGLLAACERQRRPAARRVALQFGLGSLATVTARNAREPLVAVVRQLRHDAGLDIYDALDPALPDSERFGRAFTLARERYDQTPEDERVLEPGRAIQELARVVVVVIGMAGRTYDRALLLETPSLEPLAALSPAIAAIDKNRQATIDTLSGRFAHARRRYYEVLEALGDAPSDRVSAAVHRSMRDALQLGIGTLEAHLGRDVEHWARAIEDSPLFSVDALRVRALQALRQGDAERAEQLKRQLELLKMQNRPPQLFEGSHCWPEALCYAAADDLVRVKEVMAPLEAMASQCPDWQPCLLYARAHYQRLRGDRERALATLERALDAVAPGEHLAWSAIAGSHALELLAVGRREAARQAALGAYDAALRAGLQGSLYNLHQACALIHTEMGELEAAVTHAEAAIEEHRSFGARGAPLGIAHEVRARVALAQGDEACFRDHAVACAEQFRVGHNPALTAKYERLLREAEASGVVAPPMDEPAATVVSAPEAHTGLDDVSTFLGQCRGALERAERVLELLAECSGSQGGYLYLMREGQPSLVAQVGGQPPPPQLGGMVSDYLAAELDDAEMVTATCVEVAGGGDGAWSGSSGEPLVPFLLSHSEAGNYHIAGVAVLQVPAGCFESPPAELRSAISRSLRETGDVETALVAG